MTGLRRLRLLVHGSTIAHQNETRQAPRKNKRAKTKENEMFAQERHQRILERLRESGKVTVEALAHELGVSAPTVRADLSTLESLKLLRRTHGGALPGGGSVFEPPYAERAVAQAGEKKRIGQAGADLVRDGETVLLDAGTTTHAVGLALASSNKRDITVVTNALPTALALMDVTGISTILIGGLIQPRRRATLGPLAADFLAPFRADRVFLGVSGVQASAGITAVDFDAVLVKRAMISHAGEVVVVADYSKIGQVAFAHIAPLSSVDILLTDEHLTVDGEQFLREAGLRSVLRPG